MPDIIAPTDSRASRGVAVLGATGSIGLAALDVIREQSPRFHPTLLASRRRGREILALAREYGAPTIVLIDEEAALALRSEMRAGDPELRVGQAALLESIAEPAHDVVVQGISGAAGLSPSLAAIRAGKRVALANKESFVVAGPLLLQEARSSGAVIVPVDSEHSALFQCLQAGKDREVRKLILTASGGPFRGRTRDTLGSVTREAALAHPTWDMGPRITIDSATLMNKALEVIEARWLFDVPADRIEVVVHPQSIVHSMVEFIDGSVVAQMGPPDMRGPIRYALGWPDRLPAPKPQFNVADYQSLTFEAPDRETFPALDLGFEAARRGGTAGAALNAADEMAVQRFLDGDLSFLEIASICAAALENHPFTAEPTLDQLHEVDQWARNEAKTAC